MVKLSKQKDVNLFKEKIADALKKKKHHTAKKQIKKIDKKDVVRPAKTHIKHTVRSPSVSFKPRPAKHHKKHIEHRIKHHSSVTHPSTTHHIKHHVNHQSRTVSHPIIHHKMKSKEHVEIPNTNSAEVVDPESKQDYTHKAKSSTWNFRTDKDVAMDFAIKVHRMFDHLVKATVLFGSQSTGDIKPGSDIDMVILIDDAAINWDLELTSWYREELAKIISAQDYGRDLHINTIRLTTWWRDLLHGDPVVLNIVRHGTVLIDLAGFFNPIKALMMQGKIHATPEAVYAALQRAPQHLTRSKLSMLGSIDGIYWCMVEAAQAALITLGKLPPSPEHVTKMLHENFVEAGILKSDYVKWYREIYILHKQISHGDIRHVEAKEIEAWQIRAEDFMKTLVNIIDKLIDAKNASANRPK
ncbi:MAG: nucleotidyltransferase domain-containing protein [Candidatus Pacearchaeota archaeon]